MRRRGLTLVEVMVALVVGVVVLLAAHRLLATVAPAGERSVELPPVVTLAALLRTSAIQRTRRGNGEGITGDATRATYASWCVTAGGWQVACDVTVTATRQGDQCSARVELGSEAYATHAHGACGVRYLIDAEDGGHWATAWRDDQHAPLAVALVVGRDTLLARVGRRG